MKKWNLIARGNDGRAFYQNFHVIQQTPESAFLWLKVHYPNPVVRGTLELQQVEEIEDATHFLPGIVYRSGKVYFNKQEPAVAGAR